jgi:hypothetical protein
MTLLVERRHLGFRFGECVEQSEKSKKGRKMKNAAERCAMHSPSHSMSLSKMNRSHTAYTFAHGHDAPSGIFQSVDGILEPGFGVMPLFQRRGEGRGWAVTLPPPKAGSGARKAPGRSKDRSCTKREENVDR